MKISILIFDDSKNDSNKIKSFVQHLELLLKHELNFQLEIIQRSDDSMLDSDLMTNTFHAILIDDELGNNLWGNTIIDKIIVVADHTPELAKVPKVYYSAGTSISDLKEKIKHHGNIPCETFDNLAESVFKMIKAKYHKSGK